MEKKLEQPLIPQNDDPIELELLAIHELAAHPEILQIHLLLMGGMAVAAAFENELDDSIVTN